MTQTVMLPEPTLATLERVVVGGDLSKLTSAERLMYYRAVCESVSLNPLTRPFQYLTLSGRLTLYASRDATDQLRKLHGVSIVKLETARHDDLYVVTASARDKHGREDVSTGAVALVGLRGVDLANAIMKCETKAKRRVTLSLCGLGILDETEVETVPGARAVRVDPETGEVLDGARASTTLVTPDSILSGLVSAEEGATPPGAADAAPTPTPPPPDEETLSRSLVLSQIQVLRDKVRPAVWTMALHKRGLGIDTLGRTDLAALQDLAGDLKAAVEKARP